MQLVQLKVEMNPSYHSRPGEYSGAVMFKGQHGEVSIPLNHILSQEILKLVAENMTATAKELGATIAAEIIAQVPALEQRDA